MKKSCLSDKIAATLRQELADGRYGPGRDFPTVDALRRRFGAGEYAVRHAMHLLRDAGLIAVRKHSGVEILPGAPLAWKGHVAFVAVGQPGSYFSSRLASRIALRLRDGGWDLTTAFLESSLEPLPGATQVSRIAANGPALAILHCSERQVAAAFDAAGVPYVVLNGFARDYPNARGIVRESYGESFKALVGALVARGARTLLEVDFSRVFDRGFKAQLASAGIAVNRLFREWDYLRPPQLSEISAWGHRLIADYFADDRNRRNPPKAILFDDDYLAAGGIVALLEAGLRVPRDIWVVTYSNKGNEPALGVEPARIECDPDAYGDAVAAYALKLLTGRRAAPPRIAWRFIPGAII